MIYISLVKVWSKESYQIRQENCPLIQYTQVYLTEMMRLTCFGRIYVGRDYYYSEFYLAKI